MDGTILSRRTIDVLCEAFGKTFELEELNSRAPNMFEYEVSQEIAHILSGVKKEEMEEHFDSIPLNKGVQKFIEFLKDHGFKTGIVTDSYQFLAERLAKKLGVDLIYGNAVELREGVFTGKLVIRYPCMNIPNCRKYSLCKRRVLLKLKEKICGVSVAVGDSGSDICMVQAADIGIAYNPTSAQLMNLAKFTVFSFEELEKILRPYFTF